MHVLLVPEGRCGVKHNAASQDDSTYSNSYYYSGGHDDESAFNDCHHNSGAHDDYD